MEKENRCKQKKEGDEMGIYSNTTTIPNAAAEYEVLYERGQKEVGNDDGVREGAAGDHKEQCNRIENKWEGGMEGEKGESGISNENYRSMDVYLNSRPTTTPNAAAQYEVLYERGQKEVGSNDRGREGRPTTGDGDNNEQRESGQVKSEQRETDQVKTVLVNGVDVGWHKGAAFRNGLKKFHDNYARQPDRKEVNVIQKFLEPALRQKLSQTNFRCTRIEYTGSSFEGTKVPKADDDPDFEFDMLFIIKGGDQLKKVVDLDPPIPAGFVFLEPRDQNIHEHCFEKQLVTRSVKKNLKSRTLSADKFLSNFHSELAKCINEIGDIMGVVDEKDLHRPTDYLINLRRHGPAIQMDVYPNTTSNAAAEDEVLGERDQKEVEYNDRVTEGRPTTGDGDNQQCNRIDDKWESGMEGEKGESGISKEIESSMDKIKKRNGDADKDATFDTEEEADTTSDQGNLEVNGKGNRQEVCFKFRLATKSVIGKKELKKLYSVDVVPTLHVPSPDHNPEGEYYVAKPVKGHDDRIEELKSAWRRSFSLEAKKTLKFADNEKTCKKMVFRILKAIRNCERGLDKLNTYHLKNALLKELDGTEIDQEYWSKKSLAERFMNLLERLIKDYSPGQQMSEYFIKGLDLLEHMKEATRENIHCRLKRLRNSEEEIMKILATEKQQETNDENSRRQKARKRRPRKKQANTEQAYGLSAGI